MISAISVHDPHGAQWTIRRKWLPRWARIDYRRRFFWWRSRNRNVIDYAGFDMGDYVIDGIIISVLFMVFLVLLLYVVVPILLIVFDIILVAILSVVLVSFRIVFRRPFTIIATSETGAYMERNVDGWFASRHTMKDFAQQIEEGYFR